MTEEPYAKLPLETIFFGSVTARVIDHLLTTKPFDYTIKELSSILKLSATSIDSAIQHLKDFELVEMTETTQKGKTYRVTDNPRNLALSKFLHYSAIYYLEKVHTT